MHRKNTKERSDKILKDNSCLTLSKEPLELLPFRGDISVAYVALKHQIGEIACHDAPNSVLLDNWGQNNFTLEVDFEFREFVRLRSS